MRYLLAFVLATLSFAQEKPAEAKIQLPDETPKESAVITVKTLSGESFNRLLDMLRVFPGNIRGDSQLRTIIVYAPRDVVPQIRHVVEQLDRPGSEAALGRNIEMTLTLLRCSPKAPTPSESLPADMESVARQLRAATQYKDVQLWDVVPLHLQEGRPTSESLRLPGPAAGGQPTTAIIEITPEAIVAKDHGKYVRFSRFNIDFRIPVPVSPVATGGYTFVNSQLRTAGDFREGQKTVVGKVSGTAEDDAIFAVITLKVLD